MWGREDGGFEPVSIGPYLDLGVDGIRRRIAQVYVCRRETKRRGLPPSTKLALLSFTIDGVVTNGASPRPTRYIKKSSGWLQLMIWGSQRPQGQKLG